VGHDEDDCGESEEEGCEKDGCAEKGKEGVGERVHAGEA
jgi:hypothetical protein